MTLYQSCTDDKDSEESSYLLLSVCAQDCLRKADLAITARVDLRPPPVPRAVPSHAVPEEGVLSGGRPPVVVAVVAVVPLTVLRFSEAET